MTVEYLPVGIACNLSCSYCYQDPMRDAGSINTSRNWPRVKEVLSKYNSQFAVFGGEPLLAPLDHLEEVWKFGYEKFKSNGVQTNGNLITDDHIRLFKQYAVQVGISIDGPDELNSLRVHPVDTLSATNRSLRAIERLCEEGIPPSIIVTVHKKNTGDNFLRLLAWLDDLERLGVRHINFHILEVEKGRERLTDEENTQAFLGLYLWSKSSKLSIEPFIDIIKLLTEEKPNVSCVWNHCDPLTTAAVQGVGPDGSRSNCGRTNKDGINWLKGDKPGFERYLLLRQTPQEYGGCKDCKFFIFCKGQCPGTAIEGDWRNRTADCKTWYALFERIEQDLIREGKTILSSEKKDQIERAFVRQWSGNDTPHGDFHGDSPHGDAHADSTQTYTGGVPGVWIG